MFEILTIAQAYEADRLAEKAGVDSYSLMLQAGAAVAVIAMDVCPTGDVLVLCGPGANGGDGYVAAKVLRDAGRTPQVLVFGDPTKLQGDARRAFEDWGGKVASAHSSTLPDAALIIDALFGAGLTRPLDGEAAALVEAVNASGAKVISADLPSGIAGDNGALPDTYIHADETVTFFRKKCAHVLTPGLYACGKISVADIGIPAQVIDGIAPDIFENHPGLWPGIAAAPPANAHKHARGHLLVRCGGPLNTGASRLAARAGLRAGAGLVSVLAENDAALVCAHHESEVMVMARENRTGLGTVLRHTRFGALVIGPAGGVDKRMREDVMAARAAGIPMVLDADGLSAFAQAPELLFAQLDQHCVLTPHEGEFARLFPDLSDRTISKVERARAAAERAHCVVLLKGPDTVIAAPDGRAVINTNAPVYLATAGSGDVLAGIIGALLAQGADSMAAAAAGAWLHGAAGAFCGRGLIAGDLIAALPKLWRDL